MGITEVSLQITSKALGPFFMGIRKEKKNSTQTLRIKLFSHFIFLSQSEFLSLH